METYEKNPSAIEIVTTSHIVKGQVQATKER